MSSSFRQWTARARRVLAVTAVLLALLPPGASRADNTPQPLPFSQNWTNTGLIAAPPNDNWVNVPGITGYRGDGLAATIPTDPQTVTADGTSTPPVTGSMDGHPVGAGARAGVELVRALLARAGEQLRERARRMAEGHHQGGELTRPAPDGSGSRADARRGCRREKTGS
jgi:hypothetical protein